MASISDKTAQQSRMPLYGKTNFLNGVHSIRYKCTNILNLMKLINIESEYGRLGYLWLRVVDALHGGNLTEFINKQMIRYLNKLI